MATSPAPTWMSACALRLSGTLAASARRCSKVTAAASALPSFDGVLIGAVERLGAGQRG